MTRLDWLYSALLASLPIAEHYVISPVFRQKLAADPAKARRWMYSTFIFALWLLTVLGLSLWIYEKRDWNAIALSVPDGWRAWSGASAVVIITLVQAWRASRIARSAQRLQKLREQLRQLGTLTPIIPHSESEFRLYVAVGLTAGICEEFLFRGYLIWVFHNWFGWWVAAAASTVVFALGHSYQGAKGVLVAAIAGAFMTGTVGLSGSLLPAMAIHAVLDIITAYVDWLAMRDNAPELASMQLGEASQP
jgi:uncharacterized protein